MASEQVRWAGVMGSQRREGEYNVMSSQLRQLSQHVRRAIDLEV